MYQPLDDLLIPQSAFARKQDVVLPFAPVSTEKVAVILNSNAKQVDEKVAKRLARHIPAADFFYSHTLEEAEAFARQVVQRGYGTVLCGGGDGTLTNIFNHVFRYIDEANAWRLQRARHFGERQPLLPYPEFGVLKLGTGNGLANVVGATKAVEDLQKVISGPRHPSVNMDLIECEGQRFMFGGVGYDARVLNDYNSIKAWASKSKTLKQLTATAFGYVMTVVGKTVPHMLKHGSANEVRITNLGDDAYFIDPRRGDRAVPIKAGQVIYEGPAGIVGVGTAPFYGFGFRMFPFAGVRPGMMNLRIGTLGPIKVLSNLPAIWKGNYRDSEVIDLLCTKVKVEAKTQMPYQHSGDGQGSRKELVFQVADRPLKLVDYRGSIIERPARQARFPKPTSLRARIFVAPVLCQYQRPKQGKKMALGFEIVAMGEYNLLLWAHTKENPTDDEWKAATARVAELVNVDPNAIGTLRTIVATDGGGPTTTQRSLLFREIYGGKPVKVAVFSPVFNNPILRGIITAAMWLNPGVKPFKVADWRNALQHIDMTPHAKAVAARLELLVKATPSATTLRDLARAMQDVAQSHAS